MQKIAVCAIQLHAPRALRGNHVFPVTQPNLLAGIIAEIPTKPLKSRILQSLAQIEERGFCIVDGEWQRDIRAIGVPLVSSDGSEVMALNAAGPRFAAELSTLENEIGPRLVHLSRSVAPMLGR